MIVLVRMPILGCGRVGQDLKMTVPDAALADDAVGKGADFTTRSTQHRDLQAFMSIEMDMEGGDREVVMVMLPIGQPAREIPRLVIEDISQRRKAGSGGVGGGLRPGGMAQNVTDRLGTAAIAFRCAERIDECEKFCIDGDRDPFHLHPYSDPTARLQN